MDFSEKLRTLTPLLKGRLPGQLVIQYSNRCNADCPQCGMRRSNKIKRSTLAVDRVKAIIDDAAEKGVKSLSFTGGEPLLFQNDLLNLVDYATAAGIPFVRTGTNGFLFCGSEKPDFEDRVKALAERMAATSLYTFWISLDSSVAEDHEHMRGLPGVVKGIEKAVPIFQEYGIYPSVNLGINRAVGGLQSKPFLKDGGPEKFYADFVRGFEKFYTQALNLGFTIVNSCYPMSCGDTEEEQNCCGVETELYGAVSSSDIITFSREEKSLIFKALADTIPLYRDKLRIFSPRAALYNLAGKFEMNKRSHYPCRGGREFFFVESDHGMIHPCGYHNKPSEKLPDLRHRSSDKTNCELCEWECFRDPSDLMGPFADLFTQPIHLMKHIKADPQFYKLLLQDLRYYAACTHFDGRKAPNYKAMAKFRVNQSEPSVAIEPVSKEV